LCFNDRSWQFYSAEPVLRDGDVQRALAWAARDPVLRAKALLAVRRVVGHTAALAMVPSKSELASP